MTTEVSPYQGGNYPAAVDQFAQGELNTGLDDFGIEEVPTPRLKILHREGQYQDSQTKTVYAGFNAVVLGLIKQRVMWDGEGVDGNNDDVPKCKSNDFERGMPNVDPHSLRQFPWEESPFQRALAIPDPHLNRVLLPCANCSFKQWRTKPGSNDSVPPRCSEVWNLVLMYDAYMDGNLQPAFLALKKSAVSGAKAYLATFKQRGIAAYTVWTQFTLEQESRGQTVFSKPVLTDVGPTEQSNWAQYSANYAALADFARTIRPLTGGVETGMQQQLESPEFNQNAQGVPQGAVPQTVAQAAQAAPAPAQEPQVYTPVPMPPNQQVAAQPQQAPVPPAPPTVQQAPPAPPVQQAPPAPPVQQAPPPAPPVAAPPAVAAPPVAPPPPAVPSPPPVQAVASVAPVQAPPPPAPSPAPVAPPAQQAPAATGEPSWASGDSAAPVDDDELPF